MKITVLFFGVLTEIVTGKKLVVRDVKNAEDLNRKLKEKFPELKQYVYRVFVNQELISGNKSLNNGDEVALIPPFAGG